MYPHRIRLRGPWECQRLDGAPVAPARVTMPCRWTEAGLAGYVGAARFTRKFGYPGRIDDAERVWLTCAGLTGHADLSLNGTALAKDLVGPFEYRVTHLLGPRNHLEMVLRGEDDSAGLWGEVALEIRTLAYLDDVRVCIRDDGARIVAGQVVGEGDAALELYVLADAKNVHYQPIRVGDRFEAMVPTDAKTVHLELVHVSVVWHFVTLQIPPLASPGGTAK